jgi:hypothetical protein
MKRKKVRFCFFFWKTEKTGQNNPTCALFTPNTKTIYAIADVNLEYFKTFRKERFSIF